MVLYDYDEPEPGPTIKQAQEAKARKYKEEYERYKEQLDKMVAERKEKRYNELMGKTPAPPNRGGKKQRTRKNAKSKKVKKSKKVNKTMKYKKNNRR